MKKRGIFLDRDGTLIVDKHYLKDPAGVEVLSGAREFLEWALGEGYLLFLFTNQSGIGRGYYTIEDTLACNERMVSLLDLGEGLFTEVGIAPEHPDGAQVYRKPSPRFILEMIEKYDLEAEGSWMIGDKLCDLEAGVNARVNSAWVVSCGKGRTEELESFVAEKGLLVAEKLGDLAGRLLRSPEVSV